MRVKVCGITRPDDALCAVDAGADMIGFIFVPGSARFIDPDVAARIVADLPREVLPVGVFVNAPPAVVRDTIRRSGIRAVQLHGTEQPADVEGLPARVIKAHRVGESFDVHVMLRYRVDAHLLDTYVKGMDGGTGQVFDWRIARAASATTRVILGGGLTPANVARAIEEARPAGVDVSSGVEVVPGIKEHEKIKQFVRNALQAFHNVGCTVG